MKKLLLLLVAVAFVAYSQTSKNRAPESAVQTDGVEVLSFHTKKRCPTCIAIERLAREVIEKDFAPQLADGKLVFRVVDISEDEALADEYEVTWSSLLVTRHTSGGESVNDLTDRKSVV